jgi:hypothetical protein
MTGKRSDGHEYTKKKKFLHDRIPDALCGVEYWTGVRRELWNEPITADRDDVRDAQLELRERNMKPGGRTDIHSLSVALTVRMFVFRICPDFELLEPDTLVKSERR